MSPKEKSRISMAATEDHLRAGGKKFGADRISADARDPARKFAEDVLIEIGKLAAIRAKEFGRKTLQREDVEKAVKKFANFIRVGKSTID